MIYWTLGSALVVCLFFATLSLISRKQPELGIVDGRLKPCPDTPNCVSSEDKGRPSFIEPLAIGDTPGDSWERIKNDIRNMGGSIVRENDGYLWATFTTKVFRFVDDVEMRMDKKDGIIHVRSASRVGRSDLGQNRKRVGNLRARFKQTAKAPQ